MHPERISETAQHFWYLYYAKDDRIRPVPRVQERYGVGRVESIVGAIPTRGINKNYGEQGPQHRGLMKSGYRNKEIPEPETFSDPDIGEHIDTYA